MITYLKKIDSFSTTGLTNIKFWRRKAEETEKKDEKQASKKEGRKVTSRVLYEVDATDLKMADRKKRITGSAGIFAAELLLIIFIAYLLDIWAIPLIILLVTFLPSPFVPIPSKYKITNQGVSLNGKNVFQMRPDHKLVANEIRKFVSVRHRRRGEVLKLYTPDSEKVMKILDKLIKTSEKAQSKKERK